MKSFVSRRALAVALSAVCLATPAFAQTAPTQPPADVIPRDDQDSPIADIIVTAQKRSERLSDVPISITAASADTIKELNITAPSDLGKLVPGFTFLQGNYGLPVFFIRGVGFSDTTIGVSPAVTIYVDQVPLPFSPMARGATLDLERLEVLKGPQGTLFGQNSTGGAINYIAAKPTADLRSGFDLVVGRFDQVDLEGFLSGPITDTLKARVAVRREYRGDWQRDYVNGSTNGSKDFINGRASLDWQPTSSARFALTLSGWKDRSEVQQPQFMFFAPQNPLDPDPLPVPFPIASFPAAPDDARAASFDRDFDFRRDEWFWQAALRGDMDLSANTTLTSITAYSRFKTYTPLDFDATLYPAARVFSRGTIESVSQELRLSGEAGTRMRWLIGGNYQHDKTDETQQLNPQRTTTAKIGPFSYNDFVAVNNQKTETKSVFGSLDVDLTRNLTLQGSARYTDQNRDFAGCTRDGGTGDLARAVAFLSSLVTGTVPTIPNGACVTLSTTTARPLPIITNSLDENNTAWRASLNYQLGNGALFYANVTKGYKSGSFPSLPAAFDETYAAVKQESILAYEIGTKFDLFDRRLQLTGAAFYYDYRDKQLVGTREAPPFGRLPGLVSIPKSRVQGAEIGFRAVPFTGLTLDGGVTYLDTRIQSDPVSPTGAFGGTGTFIGNRFPFTPKWQGSANVNYRRGLSATLDGFVGATVAARTGVNSTLYIGDPAVRALEQRLNMPGYTTLDLRAGVETKDGGLRAEVWGTNVTDKFYLTNINRVSDYVYRFAGAPASYGVTLRYRYGA